MQIELTELRSMHLALSLKFVSEDLVSTLLSPTNCVSKGNVTFIVSRIFSLEMIASPRVSSF